MKYRVFLMAFFCIPVLMAQEKEGDAISQQLLEKITHSEKAEKLTWLDSLASYSYRNNLLSNDSIFTETIVLAVSLDSIELAGRQLSNQINFLNNYVGKFDASIALHEKHQAWIDRIKNPGTRASILINFGDAHYYMHQYQKSIDYYNEVEELATKHDLAHYVALSTLYRGESYSFNGNFVESSKDYQEAIHLFEQLNDTTNLMSAQSSLATLYAQNGFFSEAKAIRDETIELAKEIGQLDHLIPIYYNNATDARKEGKYQEWIDNLLLSNQYVEQYEKAGYVKPIILSTLVEAYATVKDLLNAEATFQKLRELYVKESLSLDDVRFLNAQKYLTLAKGQNEKAITLGQQHLWKLREGENFEDIMNAEKFLSNVYELAGKPQKAYPHYKAFANIRDSVMNVQKINTLSYYQTLYETEKRDAKILVQENEIALLDAENRIKKQWMWLGGIGLVFLFGAILLIRSRNQARKDKQTQEHFSQQLIQSQEEQQTRVSRELHDSVGQKLMLLTKKTKSTGNADLELLAANTLEELRTISRGLHPSIIEKLGVTSAINNLIREVDANSDVFFTVELDNIDEFVNNEEGLHMYRILQELLNNMVKHAKSKSVYIALSVIEGTIQLRVEETGWYKDNTAVAKTKGKSLGMKTMQERSKIINGQLVFETTEKKWVTELIIPKQHVG